MNDQIDDLVKRVEELERVLRALTEAAAVKFFEGEVGPIPAREEEE